MNHTSPWDDRYSAPEFIYGTRPNAFLADQLAHLTPGKALFVFEGEGRNAVFAAALGWQVDCFDGSAVARNKALQWAKSQGVSLNYTTAQLQDYKFPKAQYDLVVLVFAHLPPALRTHLHQSCIQALKPGGTLLLEGFRPEQIPLTSGGPKDEAWLYTRTLLQEDFVGMQSLNIYEAQPHLDEGPLHQGPAETIRVVGVREV